MIVFAGPSLAGLDLNAYSGIEIRPPVKQGDVYLATLEKPSLIGIVDGYFEGVPSVWHKEILWALSQGINVIGAASMGALRAAEMHPFGMTGVGSIYQAYRDGDLEDDDEVALLHGPAELGYVPLSIAMVNVRATCRAARDCGVVSPIMHDHLVTTAKSIFYKDRTWQSVLAAVQNGPPGTENLSAFTHWLADHEIDQKRLDALCLLDCLIDGKIPETDREGLEGLRFENTDLWQSNTAKWRHSRQPDRSVDDTGYRLLGDDQLYR